MKPNIDVYISNHGSIFTFLPTTKQARDWIAENVQDEAQWFGGQLCVEHRYARDLANGMVADGLKLK